MVDIRQVTRYREPKGEHRHNGVRIQVAFSQELFNQIEAEAKRRGWNFSQMVRHLCDASIEGIE